MPIRSTNSSANENDKHNLLSYLLPNFDSGKDSSKKNNHKYLFFDRSFNIWMQGLVTVVNN
jgi:hypothetical protein